MIKILEAFNYQKHNSVTLRVSPITNNDFLIDLLNLKNLDENS